jgi:predicted branched-subunit amino acid permease
MKLLLAFMLMWLMLGLFAPRFERRQQLIVAGLALVMTLLYYRFGERFM